MKTKGSKPRVVGEVGVAHLRRGNDLACPTGPINTTARKSEFPELSNLPATSRQELQALRGELIGSNVCIAGDISVTGNAPVLALCRRLIEADQDPARPLHVYRGETLALRVRSLEEGAGLGVRDDNRGTPRFVRYRPGPAERAGGACGEAPPAA